MLKRRLPIATMIIVTGFLVACRPHDKMNGAAQMLAQAKATLGDPLPVSRCFDTAASPMATRDMKSAQGPASLDLPLVGLTEADWKNAGVDSVAITLRVFVVGTAHYTGGGYPSYLAVHNIRVDTLPLLAVPSAPEHGWRVICPTDLSPYVNLHELGDPGLYSNPKVFEAIVASADSLSRLHRH